MENRRRPESSTTLEAAKRATERQDWPRAAALFRQLAHAEPHWPAHWNNLTLARIRGGQVTSASGQRRAVLLRPDVAGYLNNLSAIDVNDGRAQLLRWLLVLAPGHARARIDRAFHLLQSGQAKAAFQAARLAQLTAPDVPDGLGRAVQALIAQGEVERGVALSRRYLMLDPRDRVGVGRDLARAGAVETDQAMSPDFVAGVFDGYSDRFDDHLTGTLGYVGPSVLARMLDALALGTARRAIDLGCGSGLSGLELRRFAAHLTGVDLSARMLARAGERGVYDALHRGEIVSWLEAALPGGYDLAVAADVTSYIGDLAPFFRAISTALTPGGVLAMTVHERAAGEFGIAVGDTYSHSLGHVERAAYQAGLQVTAIERGAMRMERKQPLPTMFLVFGKP